MEATVDNNHTSDKVDEFCTFFNDKNERQRMSKCCVWSVLIQHLHLYTINRPDDVLNVDTAKAT